MYVARHIIAAKFIHTEQMRSDRVLSRVFGWKNVFGQDACKRFFQNLLNPIISKLSIFFEEEYRDCRYSAYFTDLAFAAAEVRRMYCVRGDS
jgi:hypothetical protein